MSSSAQWLRGCILGVSIWFSDLASRSATVPCCLVARAARISCAVVNEGKVRLRSRYCSETLSLHCEIGSVIRW